MSLTSVTHKLNTLLDDVSYDAYNADRDAVRKGWLDRIAKSPAHLQTLLNGEEERAEESQRTLDFGNLLHTFVLEAHALDSRHYREPVVGNRNSNAAKQALREAALLNVGKTAHRPEHWDVGLKVRDAVWAHRGARAVLEADGAFEQTVFYRNSDTSELCKARFDKTSVPRAFHADLKSTIDASPEAFARSIWNYRYDVQAAHYTEPTGLRFVLIAVEKRPPFAVAVYAVSDEILRKGAQRRLPNLRTYAECRASGKWPAYPETIQRIELPRWAR